VLGQRFFSMASVRILLSDRASDLTGLQTVTATAPVNLAKLARDATYQTSLGMTFVNNIPLALEGTYVKPATTSGFGYRLPPGTPIADGYLKIERQDQNGNWTDVTVEILKLGFALYIGAMSSYQTVYGALAAIPIFLLWMYVSWLAVLLGAVVAANLPTWRVDERVVHLSGGGVRLGFSLALIAALARAQRRGASCRTAKLAKELGVATSVVDEHLQTLGRAGLAAPTQDGAWVLAWSPETATLHDLAGWTHGHLDAHTAEMAAIVRKFLDASP
jgi:hypothetical protein